MKEVWMFLAGLALICVVCFVCARGFKLWFDSRPLSVIVDGKEVYRGLSYGVEMKSLGSNTQVTVRGEGWLAIRAQAFYVSDKVSIVNLEK